MKINCAYDELVELHKIIPNPKNPNKHPDDQIERLAKIIDYQGQRSAIVVSTRSGFITKGHGRLLAIQKLAWEKAAVDFQDYESEAQEYADIVADNAVSLWAELDLAMVNKDFVEFGPEFDVDLLGVKDFVIEPIEKLEPGCDEDEVPDAPKEALVKRGDIWILGNHRLMCGDSTMIDDVEKLMAGQKADLVFTDPPYGVSYEQGKFTGAEVKKKFAPIANDEKRGDDLRDFTRQAFNNAAIVSGVCSIYAWSPPLLEGAEILASLVEAGWHIQSQIVWDKKRLVLGRADYQWRHEICWYGYKGKNHHWCGDRNQTSIWEQKRDSQYDHPTQKPVELAERAINNSSKSSANVLDLFLGSGSTLIACEKTNRVCLGLELSPVYCSVIIERWQKYSNKKATLESTGETYDQIKEQRWKASDSH